MLIYARYLYLLTMMVSLLVKAHFSTVSLTDCIQSTILSPWKFYKIFDWLFYMIHEIFVVLIHEFGFQGIWAHNQKPSNLTLYQASQLQNAMLIYDLVTFKPFSILSVIFFKFHVIYLFDANSMWHWYPNISQFQT